MRAQLKRRSSRSFAVAAMVLGALFVAQIAGAAGSPITAGPPVTFPDALGDSGTAPDMSAVVISNDASGQLSFQILIPSDPQLRSDARTFLVLDTDIDRTTGSPETGGGDYYFVIRGVDRTFTFYRWNGTAWESVTTAARVSYASGVFISINRSELGNTDEFAFYAKTRTDGEGTDDGRTDFIPDSSTETYLFPLQVPEPKPEPEPKVSISQIVTLGNGAARAGKQYSVQVSVVLDVDGTKTPVPPTRLSCSAKVGVAALKTRVTSLGSLAKTCSLVIPATAKGKTLAIQLRGSVQVKVVGAATAFSKSFTRTVRTRVR
jgi:hypothetical protein